jgi:hypothetical protein
VLLISGRQHRLVLLLQLVEALLRLGLLVGGSAPCPNILSNNPMISSPWKLSYKFQVNWMIPIGPRSE